jgi:hypothetical protein
MGGLRRGRILCFALRLVIDRSRDFIAAEDV